MRLCTQQPTDVTDYSHRCWADCDSRRFVAIRGDLLISDTPDGDGFHFQFKIQSRARRPNLTLLLLLHPIHTVSPQPTHLNPLLTMHQWKAQTRASSGPCSWLLTVENRTSSPAIFHDVYVAQFSAHDGILPKVKLHDNPKMAAPTATVTCRKCKYLLHFAHEHLDFRLAVSLRLFNIVVIFLGMELELE